MPAPDERMMTTDPTPSSPGWKPSRRGRYPNVKIQNGWQPRPGVGAGQSVGVGGTAMFPGLPGTSAGYPQDPGGGSPGYAVWEGPTQSSPSSSGANGGWGVPYRPFEYGSGNVNPPSTPPGYTPYDPYQGNVNPSHTPSSYVPYDPSQGNVNPPAGSSGGGGGGGGTPRGGGGAPARGGGGGGRVGGQAPRGGGGGGSSAPAGPSQDEMQQIAQYAAGQWGVDPAAALQELMAGAPEAAAYLRAALGMLRAGQMPAGGGAPPQEQLMPITGAAANPAGTSTTPQPAAAPYAPPRTDMHGVSGGIPGPGGPQWGSDEDYKKGVKANPVLHAAIQYGQMANAEAGPNGLTLVTYTDGNRRWFHPDGKQVHPDELAGLMSPGMTQGLDPSVMTQGVSGDKWNPAGAPGAGTTR